MISTLTARTNRDRQPAVPLNSAEVVKKPCGYKVLEPNEEQQLDAQIVTAIVNRQKPALAQLYSRYASLLMAVAYQLLNNRTDAEDLLHDVFLEVWNKAGNYDKQRGKVKTWLVLMVRSRGLDRIRTLAVAKKYAMLNQIEDEPMSTVTSPESLTDQNQVRAALSTLDDAQRGVLQLNYFQGLSCQEIADRLDTPLGTVKSRLRAAVKSLRATFETSEEPF